MKISISGVCERDMDLILIEELVADRDLLVWLCNRCDLVGEPDFDELAFTHSAVVGNGESDVEVRAKLKDGRSIVTVIENKVDASFQPRQAERYRELAEDFCKNELVHGAVTLLFAPSCYIGETTQTHGFDVTLTYEELMDWICGGDHRNERSRYKEMLFKASIEKSRRGYSKLVDGAVSSFQHRYWEMVCALEPDIIMNEPKGRPSGSSFIQFRSIGLPKGLVVVHKLEHGYSSRLAKVRAIRDYVYRIDVLERGLKYEEVTEFFVHVKSLGAKLRSSDLALAQITAKWPKSLSKFTKFQDKIQKAGFELDLGIHLKSLVIFATGQVPHCTSG